MTKEDLINFELDIEKHFLAGEIHAPVHFSSGNEDALIEIFKNIKPTDWVFSTHRNHVHALLHGIDPEWLKAEILAGHSMHINSRKHKFMTSSIVNGCTPIAVGVAMALTRQKSKDHVWCFIGDMASSVGVFHDCAQYAAKNDLPITFVIEDNGLSTNTPTQASWGTHKGKPSIMRYTYERGCAHINVAGKFVVFK